MDKLNIAIVGATGAVGQAMLQVLTEQQFPIKNLYPLASEKSVGHQVQCQGQFHAVQSLADFDFSQADIALFSAGGHVSAEFAPRAAECGCVVIDNTSHFRLDPDVPLVIPEVNPEAIKQYKKRNIIANPNCSTIQMLVALKPIYDAVGITRINVCTYQAVSGGGKKAMNELTEQTVAHLKNQEVICKVYPKPIAFNVLPHIDVFLENDYTKEEMKMVLETQKIFNDYNIKINPTAVRVPVFNGHSEAIHIETREKISKQQAIKLLKNAPGVKLFTKPQDYPTAVDVDNQNLVYVGRVREDISCDNGLNLWVVADNIRKGAAYNAVQIAELLAFDSTAL
jgi:aspartate-semialdehyde dehydrogenase